MIGHYKAYEMAHFCAATSFECNWSTACEQGMSHELRAILHRSMFAPPRGNSVIKSAAFRNMGSTEYMGGFLQQCGRRIVDCIISIMNRTENA